MTCQLYRHFDSAGRLLYVGISVCAFQRLVSHRRSEWFSRIARIDVESFQDRDDAKAAESRAIAAEHPEFNRSENPNQKLLPRELKNGQVRCSISMPESLLVLARRRASELGRTLSSYIKWLVVQDTKAITP